MLAQLRAATLVESFQHVHLGRLLPAASDDIDASPAIALEMREGFLHFHPLRRWLEAAGMLIPDEELRTLRSRADHTPLRREQAVPKLVQFFLSEEGASDVVAERLEREPDISEVVLDVAVGFRHFGDEAAGAVPVIDDEDASVVRSFARRIERLCGVRLVDHLKRSL